MPHAGSIIVTASGRILSLTPGLPQLLSHLDLVTISASDLAINDGRVDELMHQALHRDLEHMDDPACEIDIAPAGQAATVRITASRLDAPERTEPGADPLLLVTFTVKPAKPLFPAIFLSSGLTPAEQELALAYGRGGSIRSLSTARARSVETIRTHLKTAMSKLGVHRQVDLALIIAKADAAERR